MWKGKMIMTHTTVEKQIQMVPEEYLDEVSAFIDYVVYKANRRKRTSSNASECFGSITRAIDGLDFQRNSRDECN